MDPQTTPTTMLEAVNILLEAINESPVSSLTDPDGADVPTAVSVIKHTLQAVLSEGWEFNTEHDYPLTRDIDGEISIPPNFLEVDINNREYPDVHPVQRGNRLYDRKNHTYKFDKNLKADVIVGLTFEEIPQAARYYVATRAARAFTDTQIGSNDLHQFFQQEEYKARATLEERHTEAQELHMLRDTPSFRLHYYNTL